MAGMLGCGGGPPTLFLPSRCFEAAGLEEGAGDHGHQGVSVNPVQDLPSSDNAAAKLFKVSIASAVNFRYAGAMACVTRVLHQMPTIGDLDCLWERLGGLRSRRT